MHVGCVHRALVRSHKDVQETTGHGSSGFEEISETHQDLVWST